MFAKFLKQLLEPEPETLKVEDAQLAITALLVRVARSDDNYEESEIKKIDRILEAHYKLDKKAIASLRCKAEILEQEAPDTVRFTRAIKNALPHSERIIFMEALWTIALTDGVRDIEEDALIRLVSGLLGITDVESNTARRKAAKSI